MKNQISLKIDLTKAPGITQIEKDIEAVSKKLSELNGMFSDLKTKKEELQTQYALSEAHKFFGYEEGEMYRAIPRSGDGKVMQGEFRGYLIGYQFSVSLSFLEYDRKGIAKHLHRLPHNQWTLEKIN